MSIITSEMVEAGALEAAKCQVGNTRLRKYLEGWFIPDYPTMEEEADAEREAIKVLNSIARACLEAVLPGILERCAKEAEGPVYEERYRGGPGSNWVVDGSSPYGNGRLDAAASIRSLQTKDIADAQR